MDKLKKCSGSLNSGDSVNCPLRFDCERFKVQSIGVMQEFIKPVHNHLKDNLFMCLNYIAGDGK